MGGAKTSLNPGRKRKYNACSREAKEGDLLPSVSASRLPCRVVAPVTPGAHVDRVGAKEHLRSCSDWSYPAAAPGCSLA